MEKKKTKWEKKRNKVGRGRKWGKKERGGRNEVEEGKKWRK